MKYYYTFETIFCNNKLSLLYRINAIKKIMLKEKLLIVSRYSRCRL